MLYVGPYCVYLHSEIDRSSTRIGGNKYSLLTDLLVSKGEINTLYLLDTRNGETRKLKRRAVRKILATRDAELLQDWKRQRQKRHHTLNYIVRFNERQQR